MNIGRLEAFTDAIIAIIITIIVNEIKVPHTTNFQDALTLIPQLVSYILSFAFLGIYWTNHHHMIQGVKRVTGKILWANLHLLFWLSLIPFFSKWVGEIYYQSAPMARYGFVLLMASLAYRLLKYLIVKTNKEAMLSTVIGNDLKGRISPTIYVVGI